MIYIFINFGKMVVQTQPPNGFSGTHRWVLGSTTCMGATDGFEGKCWEWAMLAHPWKPPMFPSWWLNHPIEKICSSKWVHLPQIRVKIAYTWNHHRTTYLFLVPVEFSLFVNVCWVQWWFIDFEKCSFVWWMVLAEWSCLFFFISAYIHLLDMLWLSVGVSLSLTSGQLLSTGQLVTCYV